MTQPDEDLDDISADQDLRATSPPVLLAMLIAARRTGDDLLKEIAERELTRHGIAVIFGSNMVYEMRQQERKEGGDADEG
jgi:hypothetical protein